MRSYNGDSVLKAENPPELPRDETEVDPLVDPMTNPVVDPVNDPLNPMIGVDDKTDTDATDGADTILTDSTNPYSDISPTPDNPEEFSGPSDFHEGTPL